LKHFIRIVLFIPILLLSGCTTSSYTLKLAPPKSYSLEGLGGPFWQIKNNSEYYAYFNKMHQTYYALMKNVKDPAELRRLFIERDLKIAKKRLEHMADPRLVKEVIGATRFRNGTNPTGHIFRKNDVEYVPHQNFTPADPSKFVYQELTPAFGFAATDAMTAIIQFDRQLKKRGVTLLVVPVPNSAQIYTHLLHPDIHLEDVVWHPWAHMIAKLLENDVEVIDLEDLFKAYSGNNTVLNYIDHHWGEVGMDIVSWEIAQRLKRFRFDPQDYLDPAYIKRVPITIPTPALIPFWDKIDIGDIASSMPYSPTYPTVRITYKDQNIRPARTFEDSPVLIMGDSFIFHAEDTSSGIYAHLAYRTRIIPAQFSRNAAAAYPPEWYRGSVAGKGKEPKVVIWEMYGSALAEYNNQNNWMVVDMPAPPKTVVEPPRQTTAATVEPAAQKNFTITPDRKLEWITGEVIKVSEIPNLQKIDYPDALYAFQVRVTDKLSSRLEKGTTIVVYRQFTEKYKLMKDTILKKGDKRSFYLEKWTQATQAVDKIGTMQLIDDLEDYESEVYFSHFLEDRVDTRLAKLNKQFLEKGAVDKEGKPLEALTFKIKLIANIKARLHQEKAKAALFAIETSIDGTNWFSIYKCQSIGGDEEIRTIALESVHPALFVRFSGPAVRKVIAFDNNKPDASGFSGLEIFGY
jgi:hypothetical protein